MSEQPGHDAAPLRTTPKGRLGFREGGWLLVLSAIVTLALLAWGLAPAILRLADRPPGDGINIESYAFDLSNPRVPLSEIEPAMLHRDMVPVEYDPVVLSGEAVAEANEGRRRYLVSNDMVIGLEINDQERAYPFSILNVHEVINDQLGDTPVSITWHWPSGATRVFDRRIGDSVLTLGVSGLVYGGNQLLYPRRDDGQHGGEPLISQALGRSITGSDLSLQAIAHEVVPWSDWVARHPDTSVAAARPELEARYKKGKPDTWFASSEVMFNTPLPTIGPSPKTHMLLIRGPAATTIVSLEDLIAAADESGSVTLTHNGSLVHLVATSSPISARIASGPGNLEAMRILWISGHALVPEAGPPARPIPTAHGIPPASP